MYTPYLEIRPNPILESWFLTLYRPRAHHIQEVTSVPDSSAYSANLREFLTAPPITEIAFFYRFYSYTAIIEERDGIRVGDVVEMLDRMRPCAVARVLRDEASPSAPGAEPVAWYEICDESWDLDDCTSALKLD
jgi:hypothetical protein